MTYVAELYRQAVKNSHAVIFVTVMGAFFAVIQFSAFNGFGDRAEFPDNPPLTVQFLPGFFAQLLPGDKPGHEHHLPSDGSGKL
jgi:hypothetical protein